VFLHPLLDFWVAFPAVEEGYVQTGQLLYSK